MAYRGAPPSPWLKDGLTGASCANDDVIEFPPLTLIGALSPVAYCCASCASTLFGRLIISSVADPKPDEEMLVLEPAPELSEFDELERPIEEPEAELDTALPLLLSELLEVVAAIGTDTLFVWLELGSGRAIVTGCGCCSSPPEEDGNCT